jgi:hypothetical protein
VRQVVITALAACAGLSGAWAEEPPQDPRVVELLRQECVTATGRRDVTLFANGTVRVREVGPNARGLLLGELGPVELEGFRRRLAELDLSETDRRESVVAGALIERCRLELRRDGRAAESFDYGRFGSHSLALAAALRIAEDLAAIARPETARASLPRGYAPKAGDILVRTDGERFAVVGLTGDGKGVELAGVRVPLVLYVQIADLDREFVALERRDSLR